MRKFTAVLIVLFWFFWTLAPLYADQPDTGHLIVPGKGIGPVQVGMTLDALKAALGPEDNVGTNQCLVFYAWRTSGGGWLGGEAKDSKVVIVAIQNDPQYLTPQGAHSGMTRDEVIRVLGKPYWTNQLDTEEVLGYHGMSISIPKKDQDGSAAGTVRTIRVAASDVVTCSN